MPNTHSRADLADVLPLSAEESSWLEMLKSDWQIVADLGAADLILWLPTPGGRFVAAAMCRPATSTTVHPDDVIGLYASAPRAVLLTEAMDSGEIIEDVSTQWSGLYSVQRSFVPIRYQGRSIAVMTVERNMSSPFGQTQDQTWMGSAADMLCQMIVSEDYPSSEAPSRSGRGVPRVTDGPILIDPEGVVLEITPNANSAMRRLGIPLPVEGRSLIEEVVKVVRNEHQIEEALAVVIMGRAHWRVDVEASGAIVTVRAIPLVVDGQRRGAVLLTRDVTEKHRHEQQLMTKDATIREIHHRVKNNLQTVSALLRIQERRTDSDDVKEALQGAGRRVDAIAAVHDALSHNVDEVVDFDDVSQRILKMAAKVATVGPEVGVEVDGTFGLLSADQAAALATVLAELVANSVEHGYPDEPGTVWVHAQRSDNELEIQIEDAGKGIDVHSLDQGLGTKIIKAMVRGELGGTIAWKNREGGGTLASLRLHPDVPTRENAR